MKRSKALVDYRSSSEEECVAKEPVKIKKRKLPSLSSSLVLPVPKDNPALHQGRIRSTPHVEGQWAVHVYVPVLVERKCPLYQLLQDVLKAAKEISPALQAVADVDGIGDKNVIELHISLSRPIFVRAYQREEIRRCVKRLAQSNLPFKVSFSSFSVLTNDERTRTFLALDVGGGFPELKSLAQGLTPTLETLRQKVYYAEPQFHASIAWALLSTPTLGQILESSITETPTPQDVCTLRANSASTLDEGLDLVMMSTAMDFQRIPGLPESLITTLNDEYATLLCSNRVSAFDVRRLNATIGKEVFSWQFEGG
ncbi:hypothetical protein E1B28_012397 [Marasmius oreades]|uniref:U6 snRNA phosphodiesterase 1 n=1 Tax=Marasmius oreades TaxID=181124 RepID=A0A9P7UQR3_9AGAR|nr:uncharacterized protein E1B28_012397 [Marasmius oreades]KAG7088399.1 hypothetical protein E1B28_012397 [Marasmius oreades]